MKNILKKINFHYKVIMIFVSVFIIIFILLSLYNTKALTLWTEYSGEYDLKIKIISNNTDEYCILIPCIVNRTNIIVPEFMNNLVSNGTGTHDIIDTDYGPMLKITATGNYSLLSTYIFDTHKGDKVRYGFDYIFSSIHENETHYSYPNLFCYATILSYSGSTLIIDYNLDISESGYFYNGLGQGGWNWRTGGNIRTNGTVTKNLSEIPFTQDLVSGDAFVGWGFFSDIGKYSPLGLAGNFGLLICLIFINKQQEIQKKHFYLFISILLILMFSSILTLQIFYFHETIFLGEPSIMNTDFVTSDNTLCFLIGLSLLIFLINIVLVFKLKKKLFPKIIESEKERPSD